jgi:hypothetical protein
MKNRNRYFATFLIVSLFIGIFAFAGFLQAAESDKAIEEGKKTIMEGAKQIMDGNKMIMGLMASKGIKDPELTAAEKKMAEGYGMVTKGESMMTGSTMAEGKVMVKDGSKMMLDAQQATAAVVDKHGMTVQCSAALDTCVSGEKKVKEGHLDWYFGSPE